MNAEQARKLTEKSRKGGDGQVQALLEHVIKLIESAAKKGECEIISPLVGLRTPISYEVEMAVYARLRGKGYTVDVEAGCNNRVSW